MDSLSTPVEFSINLLDQTFIWHMADHEPRFIISMSEQEVLWALDYLLANALELRWMWAINSHKMFDEAQRGRRWMLDKKLVRALMRRLIAIELDVQ